MVVVCDHGFPIDGQLVLGWRADGTPIEGFASDCLLCDAITWIDHAIRRLKCRVFKHVLHTEYRREVDFYGETWCQRCGEYEPKKWCPDG